MMGMMRGRVRGILNKKSPAEQDPRGVIIALKF